MAHTTKVDAYELAAGGVAALPAAGELDVVKRQGATTSL